MKTRWAIGLAILACACGGVAARSPAADAAGAPNGDADAAGAPDGDADAAGASAGGRTSAGGAAGATACAGYGEYCYPACSIERVALVQVCSQGVWQCPAGTSLIDDCPPYPCLSDAVVCCDVTSGQTASPACDASGQRYRCPKLNEARSATSECVAKPKACQVDSSTDLDGTSCSLGDPMCRFGSGCTTCTCECGEQASGKLAWRCGCVLC